MSTDSVYRISPRYKIRFQIGVRINSAECLTGTPEAFHISRSLTSGTQRAMGQRSAQWRDVEFHGDWQTDDGQWTDRE